VKRLVDEYRSSLKAPEVEEHVDLWVHRPLAFVVAKLAYPTPLSPNHLTAFAILLGFAGGLCLFSSANAVVLLGAALIFASQVVDCSDGMLARMRRSSSELGRMLDGAADSLALSSVVAGTLYRIAQMVDGPDYAPVLVVVAGLLTVHTSSLHTMAYDHYKNAYARWTVPGSREGEDLDAARARHARALEAERNGPPMGWLLRTVFAMYLGYLERTRRFLAWFDPHTQARLDAIPAHDPLAAEVYRRHHHVLMDVWRSLFGVGSLVLGLAFFNAIGRPDLFLVYRLFLLNAVFFVLWRLQRRASLASSRELGFRQPSAEPVTV
jgi:phosphatidylglycerophosphate synthase